MEPIEVDAQRARALIEGDGVQVVDVREDDELASGTIAGSRHIALGSLSEQAPSLDKERPVLFYCRSGARSLMAAEAFRQAGFEAYNLTGGILAWRDGGHPLA